MLIELQSHSTVSDGQLAPTEVVVKAAEAGVTTLALTDHDAIAGVPEAEEAADRLRLRAGPARAGLPGGRDRREAAGGGIRPPPRGRGAGGGRCALDRASS